MLSMKALKVMIATMGSALLLGSGMAMAIDVGNPEDEPYLVAVESLGMATSTRASAPDAISVTLPAGAEISATSNARLFSGRSWYVRLDLRNMVFAHGSASIVFTDSEYNGTHEIAQTLGSDRPAGVDEFVVIRLNTTLGEYPIGTKFSFDVSGERLAVLQEDTEESTSRKIYDAELALYDDFSEAITATQRDFGQEIFGGKRPIIDIGPALGVGINNGTPAIASVTEQFLKFRYGPPHMTCTSAPATCGAVLSRDLGSFSAGLNSDEWLNAATGATFTADELIEEVRVTIPEGQGDLSFGTFSIGGKAIGDERMVSFDGPVADAFLNVAVDGETSIPVGEYSAALEVDTVDFKGTSSPVTRPFSGPIGTILRDGTTVQLTYLTVSEKYNQRLIIVNRSSEPAAYSLIGFAEEEGVTVTATDAAEGTVPAVSSVVLRVADLIAFDSEPAAAGRTRTAATLSIDASPAHVEVATTQVNLEDGSTDTVLYAAESIVDIQEPTTQ